jgi:hypothetical protein
MTKTELDNYFKDGGDKNIAVASSGCGLKQPATCNIKICIQ